jgi:hypothetical protein
LVSSLLKPLYWGFYNVVMYYTLIFYRKLGILNLR